MLHELLLALSGHTGDVFVKTAATFAVADHFPFLHTAERSTLNSLAELGFKYDAISAFTSTPSKAPYTIALQRAVSAATLPYRRALCQLEKDILSGNFPGDIERPPLSHFSTAITAHEQQLTYLHSIIIRVSEAPERWHGCRLLDLLYERVCGAGVPETQKIGEELLWKIRKVFLRQCGAWILYGEINDKENEFFVTRREELVVDPDDSNKSHTGHDRKEDQGRAEGGLWQTVYRLDESLIPKYVPRALAESILFVGKAVAALQQAIDVTRSLQNASLRDQILNYGDGAALSKEITDRHIRILNDLATSKKVYSVLEIECAIDEIRRDVSDELWFVVVRGPVPGKHLLADLLLSIRHYALIGRGDWAISLIEQMRKLQHARRHRKTSSTLREGELNATFRRSAYGTSAENDAMLERLRLMVTPLLSGPDTPKQWYDFDTRFIPGTPIRLRCDIHWPLDLVLSSRDGERYSRIFAFLVALRSVQVSLQRLGVGAGRTIGDNHPKTSAVRNHEVAAHTRFVSPRNVWKLRQAMLFWVDGLWAHVQMDVIDANFRQLYRRLVVPQPTGASSSSVEHGKSRSESEDLSSTGRRTAELPELRDLEDIRAAHSVYLDIIEHGCLLSSPKILSAVRDIMAQCEKFVACAETAGESVDEDVHDMEITFRETIQFLFRALSGASKHITVSPPPSSSNHHKPSDAPPSSPPSITTDTLPVSTTSNRPHRPLSTPPSTSTLPVATIPAILLSKHQAQVRAARQRHLDQLLLRWDYSKWFSVAFEET